MSLPQPLQQVMFDVDGTLVHSSDIDGRLFSAAVADETGLALDTNWSRYRHVTDAGILHELLRAAGMVEQFDDTCARVKHNFYCRLREHLALNPLQQVAGAARLIEILNARDDVVVSMTTGGWGETARLKLQSAGLELEEIPLASSNDHYRRIDIMRIAAGRADGGCLPCTYFGDGVWDKMASAELGYDFVLVGDATDHDRRIEDFSNAAQVLAAIGLPAARD